MAGIREQSQWKRVLGSRSLPFLLQWGIRRGFRILTARIRSLPDFLIIGAQRCGTTSLYNYLVEHPHVSPAFMKETHFFDLHFHRGANWYRAFFPTTHRFSVAGFGLARRDRSVKPADDHPSNDAFRSRSHRRTLTGESTPYYLFYPHAPQRVKVMIPEVKLIVLLRNPVDRAYSHYHHEVRTGAEAASFEDALEREAEIMPGEIAKTWEDGRYRSFSHIHHSYLSRGIYVDQLRRWIELFGREQMIVIRSEDLYRDPAMTVDRVLRFLGLSRWTKSQYTMYNLAHYDRMDAAIRNRLLAHFEPHNRRLYEYLHVDMGWEN